MKKKLNYLVDENGNKIAVVVPIAVWTSFKNKYDECLKKAHILTGIQSGLNEVNESKRNGRKLQTLKSFLN